jgi:hypothetical protein
MTALGLVATFAITYLLFVIVLHIMVAVGNGYLAARLDRNVAARVFLSLIPRLLAGSALAKPCQRR